MYIDYGLRDYYPWVQGYALLLPVAVFMRVWLWKRSFAKTSANILLGYNGEQVVAERLDALKEIGYRIIHDIPSLRPGGANIDHLAVGPSGVFVIETKTHSHPVGRRAKVTYDGESLLVDGYPYESWFLNKRGNLLSSHQLEVAATEFECQGLELDWTCVCCLRAFPRALWRSIFGGAHHRSFSRTECTFAEPRVPPRNGRAQARSGCGALCARPPRN